MRPIMPGKYVKEAYYLLRQFLQHQKKSNQGTLEKLLRENDNIFNLVYSGKRRDNSLL